MIRFPLKVSPQNLRIFGLIVVLICVLLFFSTQIHNYLNKDLFIRVSTSVAIMALIAIGQTLVILTRNIDLSVGSVVGFSAFFLGGLLARNPNINPLLVVLAGVGFGSLFGMLNGFLVAYANVPSIIVTLGTMALYRSSLVQFSGAKSISTASLPHWLVSLPQMNVISVAGYDIRVTFVITLVVLLVAHFALTRLRGGRHFYAVGSNPAAARFAGINVNRTVFLAFTLSGALAGLTGFLFLARFGNITVVAGLGFELKSVASAVVGGVNIFGGSGSVIGAFLGAILVDVLDTSLVRWEVISEFWREAVLGALILLSVTADTLLSRKLLAISLKKTKSTRQQITTFEDSLTTRKGP
jgi:rhamnose transport system permease protein